MTADLKRRAAGRERLWKIARFVNEPRKISDRTHFSQNAGILRLFAQKLQTLGVRFFLFFFLFPSLPANHAKQIYRARTIIDKRLKVERVPVRCLIKWSQRWRIVCDNYARSKGTVREMRHPIPLWLSSRYSKPEQRRLFGYQTRHDRIIDDKLRQEYNHFEILNNCFRITRESFAWKMKIIYVSQSTLSAGN